MAKRGSSSLLHLLTYSASCLLFSPPLIVNNDRSCLSVFLKLLWWWATLLSPMLLFFFMFSSVMDEYVFRDRCGRKINSSFIKNLLCICSTHCTQSLWNVNVCMYTMLSAMLALLWVTQIACCCVTIFLWIHTPLGMKWRLWVRFLMKAVVDPFWSWRHLLQFK